MKGNQKLLRELRNLNAPMKQANGSSHMKIYDPSGRHIVAIIGIGSIEPRARAIQNVRAQLRRAGYAV